MHNDTDNDPIKKSAVCLDDDCNVMILDTDGDGKPDYVVLRISWLLSVATSIVSVIYLWIV